MYSYIHIWNLEERSDKDRSKDLKGAKYRKIRADLVPVGPRLTPSENKDGSHGEARADCDKLSMCHVMVKQMLASCHHRELEIENVLSIASKRTWTCHVTSKDCLVGHRVGTKL